jgi:predicted ATPase
VTAVAPDVGLRVAAQLLPAHEDGAIFLDLAPITNPHMLPSVLVSELRIPGTSMDAARSPISFLHDKRMMIVFDSCERILDASAQLAETLLREAPGITILATSREALRIEGESVYRLSPLDVPPHAAVLTSLDALSYPAVQLFVERASLSWSKNSFDDDEAPIVAHICRRLDGIALAIELAAARVEAFGTRGTAELLNDRLRLLTGGRRTALPRHQTMAAMIEGLGCGRRAAHRLPSRLAAFSRRLGQPDALLPGEGVSGYRA